MEKENKKKRSAKKADVNPKPEPESGIFEDSVTKFTFVWGNDTQGKPLDPQAEEEKGIPELNKLIGKNLRKERMGRKLTIEEVAEQVGLSASYIGLIERGMRCPVIDKLLKFCDVFDCTPNDLLTEQKGSKAMFSFAEKKNNTYNNKYNTVLTLLKGLDEGELEFIANSIKCLKQMKKMEEERNSPNN